MAQPMKKEDIAKAIKKTKTRKGHPLDEDISPIKRCGKCKQPFSFGKCKCKPVRKKQPTTLFGYQIQHSPDAHKLSIALNMAQVSCNIPTCDLILRVQKKMVEMGGKFDLSTAIDIKMQVTDEYDKLEAKFKKKSNKKQV